MPTAELESRTFTGLRTHLDGRDAALVLRMRAGDQGSFEEIFKRHQAPLLSYCRHMLGNRDEAEDALQQAFIRAHKALLGDSPPRELRPWLYAIARNCCLSAIARRAPTAELDDRTPSLAGLSDQVHEREDLRELVADIGRLPEAQRSALLLAELDDLSHPAIATIVGCPVSKVKALVYQARSTLLAEREAREASCRDIREQLAVARGGELRRGPLRRHVRMCAGCSDFQEALGAHRQSLAAVLPVLPSALLAARILGHGALSAAGTAGVGGAGATVAPAGAGTASGATAVASAPSAITAAGTAGTTTAVGAGTVGGTSTGALLGGGLVAKVAIGGAVAALAGVGAVAIPHRLAHAPQRAVRSRPRDAVDLQRASPSAATSRPGQLGQTVALPQPGGAAQAPGAIGVGSAEAGLSGIGGPGARKLEATGLSGLGGAGSAALLAANGALIGSRPLAGLPRGAVQPAGKLSPAAHPHLGPGARRGRLRTLHGRVLERRLTLKRRRALKRRAIVKRSDARPHRRAVVGSAPKRPAYRKKIPLAISTPGLYPVKPSTQTAGRTGAAGQPRPLSNARRSGRTSAPAPALPGTTPAARRRSGGEEASPGRGVTGPVGPSGASGTGSATSAGNALKATGVTGAVATESPKAQAASTTSIRDAGAQPANLHRFRPVISVAMHLNPTGGTRHASS